MTDKFNKSITEVTCNAVKSGNHSIQIFCYSKKIQYIYINDVLHNGCFPIILTGNYKKIKNYIDRNSMIYHNLLTSMSPSSKYGNHGCFLQICPTQSVIKALQTTSLPDDIITYGIMQYMI
jgi:hypothetical protein